MHIRIINPDYGVTPAAMADRCRMLQRVTGPDVQLSMVCLTQTHVEINSPADVVAAGPEILSLARQAEADGCDAVVLYCFSDPALEACRDSLSIPVVGGAQASLLLVPHVARQVAVLLADKSRIPEKKLWLPTLGLAPERIWGVAAVDMGGVDIWQHRDEALAKLTEAGRQLVADGAPCLVLGCLSFLGLARPLEEALGVPVVDPAEAAVVMAEALARLRRK
jgi:allantoin racemase